MSNLGDFHDLYVLTDVLLLADVFERFRDMTLEYYTLDAAHFYTSRGLAWQAALKMSGICLDLITDPIVYNMIELGTRGGTSMVTKNTVVPITNTWKISTRRKIQFTIYIWTPEIFMDGQCRNHYLMDFYTFYQRMKSKHLICKRLASIPKRDIFYKWI